MPAPPPPPNLRLLNLATLLEEEHPGVAPPPAGATGSAGGGGKGEGALLLTHLAWTEDQLRAHFAGGGQVGGAAVGPSPPPGPVPAPPGAAAAADAGSAASYRAATAARGIPPRPAGLFPASDPLLARLAATPGAWPFEKLLPGDGVSHAPPALSWASGNGAAAAGVDLRLWCVPTGPPPDDGGGGTAATATAFPVRGAVRFGEGASIGAGHWLPVHGGAVRLFVGMMDGW